jgi:hypothetical protein
VPNGTFHKSKDIFWDNKSISIAELFLQIKKAISLKLVRGFSEIAFYVSSIMDLGLPISMRIFLLEDSIFYWIESLHMVISEAVS